MDFTIIDYLLAALLAVAIPIWGALDHRRLKREVAAGKPGARINAYRITMIVEWVAMAAVVLTWLLSGRSLASLGFGLTASTGLWVGVLLTGLAVGLLIGQAIWVGRSRAKLQEVRDQVSDLEALIPREKREARWWFGLSVTAGVCEETTYRGFLIAVLAGTFSIWPAVVLASVLFGLAHIYQGGKGALRTGVVGLITGGLFILTGSLWAPILLHVVLDLVSGHVGRRALLQSENLAPPLAA